MPRTDVHATDRDGKDITYSGVSLAELLRVAGLKLDPASMPSRDNVASYILVEAADGYRAVFAMAEIDPAQTDRVILLADHKEGKALFGNEGPFRIVVPGEKRPARWVRQVQKILVGRRSSPTTCGIIITNGLCRKRSLILASTATWSIRSQRNRAVIQWLLLAPHVA